MDFSTMNYEQFVSERERPEAELEKIKREQHRKYEPSQAHRKAIYDRLPDAVGTRLGIDKTDDGEFQLAHEGGMAWHPWVSLALDILDAHQRAETDVLQRGV